MGRAVQFYRPLTRTPIPAFTRFSGAGGAHRGVECPNVPREVYLACADGDTINADTYQALHTTIDLDGLYDLLEMRQVQASWKEAAIANAREANG